jgi:succinate dehydrogenase / fumarate reductase cytochrome b subunit
MIRPHSFLGSSIGKKVVMAVTGAILVGFAVAHMLGNLQLYLGAEALNAYAVFLRNTHGALWVARAVLLVSALLHVWAAWALTMDNRKARPQGYRAKENRESTVSSRTMRWTGVALLLFIVYHLLDLTFGTVNPGFIEGQVFHNVVVSFSRAGTAAVYILAMIALGLHLYHGIWSFMQTLGLSHPRYDPWRHRVALLTAIVLVVGNMSFPLAVKLGLVQDRTTTAQLSVR